MIEEGKPNVGLRLRMFRERQGWSLRTLAERCGLSINAISRIERGENSPTVSSLNRLSIALGVPITDFFVEKPYQSVISIKKGAGEIIHSRGYTAERLGFGLPGQQMEPFRMEIPPNSGSANRPIHHPGEEFVHCLEGLVEYVVNEQSYLLEPGDSLLFEGMQPHTWCNVGPTMAVLLLVFQTSKDHNLARQRHYPE